MESDIGLAMMMLIGAGVLWALEGIVGLFKSIEHETVVETRLVIICLLLMALYFK